MKYYALRARAKIVCRDQLDEAILQVLYESGRGGILPKDIAYRLRTYGVYRQKVSRRVRGMNRRLRRELGRDVAEKQGYKWALTSFMFNVWGETKGEISSVPSRIPT